MFMLALIIMERGKWIKMTKDLNKKGEGNIGGGITWFIATLIIFIIMVFFVLACLTAGSINKITQGKHDISIVLEQGNLIETEMLYALLETRIENIKLRELILEWNKTQPLSDKKRGELKEKIIGGVNDILSKYENCKYIFDVDATPENLKNRPIGPRGAVFYYRLISYYKIRKTNIQSGTSNLRSMPYFTSYFNTLLNQSSKINIGGKENQIWIRFYLEC